MAISLTKTTQSSARLNLLIVFHKVKSDRNFHFHEEKRESLGRERKKVFNEFCRNFTLTFFCLINHTKRSFHLVSLRQLSR